MTAPASRTYDAPAWLVWTALWTVYVVWGSTYLAIRVMVETLPPLLATGLRFVVAGLVLLLVLTVRRGRAAISVTRRELTGAAVVGCALLLGGNGLVVLAERDIPSSVAALVVAAVPMWVILLRSATGDKVGAPTLASVAVGFVGVALLVLPAGDRPEGMRPLGLAMVVVASLSWACGSFVATRMSMPKDALVSTGYQMLLGGGALFAAGLVTGEAGHVDVESFSTASLGALLYLVVMGSLVGFTAYAWLLQNAPISKVSTYAYVNPVIAIVLGWWILSERLTPVMFVGAALIVASTAFVVRRESRRPAVETAEPVPALAGADSG
ncbi:MAG TPA: EamA family transporter [Actinomycetota bacterium]|nr:EamA family transporter [Actinomycetota bacterium]